MKMNTTRAELESVSYKKELLFSVDYSVNESDPRTCNSLFNSLIQWVGAID
jgi:hypothetical protein